MPTETPSRLSNVARHFPVTPQGRLGFELVPEPVVHPREHLRPRCVEIELSRKASGGGFVSGETHLEHRADAFLALAAIEIGSVSSKADSQTLERLGHPLPDRANLVHPACLATVEIEAHPLRVERWFQKPMASKWGRILVGALTRNNRPVELTPEKERDRRKHGAEVSFDRE